MPAITYQKIDRKMINVLRDGAFAGHLVQEYRRPPAGICTPNSYSIWCGTIDGRDVQSRTLTNAKRMIEVAPSSVALA